MAYKVLAHILLQRLKSGRAELCIWHTHSFVCKKQGDRRRFVSCSPVLVKVKSKSSPNEANKLGPRADTGWHKATASEYHQDVDGRLCTTYASEYICAALRRAGG